MKFIFTLAIVFILNDYCRAQQYPTAPECDTDTIHVKYRDLKYGSLIEYRTFKCKKVSPWGFRAELAYMRFTYNSKTADWLGNPSGGIIGFAIAHRRVNFGVRFKLATVSPRIPMVISGDTLTRTDTLNPVKIDFHLGYSFDFAGNFSIEPYLGISRNLFYVINEKRTGKSFSIPRVYGLMTGATLNKYLRIKRFQFMSLFVTGGYNFANFKRVNSRLGRGYAEWAVGLAYKGFGQQRYHQKIRA
jgi:hypothetical protein